MSKEEKPKQKRNQKKEYRKSGGEKMNVERIEELAGRGLTKEQVAQCLGVSRRLYHYYQQKNPAFLEAFDRGRANATAAIAGKIISHVQRNSLTAAMFWLKCNAGWSETNTTRHVGEDGKAIKVQVIDDV